MVQRGNDSIAWLEDKSDDWGRGLEGLAASMHFTWPPHRAETTVESPRKVNETYAASTHLRTCLI